MLVASLYGCLGITEKQKEPTEVEKEVVSSITWVDYKNTDFGVSLKYPDNWIIDESEQGFLNFTPKSFSDQPSPYFVKIVKLDNYDNKTLTEYLNLEDDYSMSKIGVDDLVAIKRPEPPESFSHFYYVERSPYIYKFVYMNLDDELDYVSNQVFYEILGSFRFIPFTSTITESTTSETEKPAEEKVEETASTEGATGDTETTEDEEVTTEESEATATEASEPEETVTTETKITTETAVAPVVEEGLSTESSSEEDMQYFVSGPYKFKALYPFKWYYSGAHFGGQDNILHRYSFSEEPSGDTVITLDIVDEAMPSEAQAVNGRQIYKVTGGSKTIIYVKISEQVYKLTAPSDMEDLADKITLSIIETAE